jgi:hypothetical protein
VEKLDNPGRYPWLLSFLPKGAVLEDRFSKSGHDANVLSEMELALKSTFPATTVTTASISLSFIYFLRSTRSSR